MQRVIRLGGVVGNGKHQAGSVFDDGGICPTLCAEPHGNTVPYVMEVKELETYEVPEVRVIGQMDNTKDGTFESANRVYDSNAIVPTIPTCGGKIYSRRFWR